MDRINLRSVRSFLPNCQWRVWGLDLVHRVSFRNLNNITPTQNALWQGVVSFTPCF